MKQVSVSLSPSIAELTFIYKKSFRPSVGRSVTLSLKTRKIEILGHMRHTKAVICILAFSSVSQFCRRSVCHAFMNVKESRPFQKIKARGSQNRVVEAEGKAGSGSGGSAKKFTVS